MPSYNRGNSAFICHLDIKGCKLEQQHFIKKWKKCRVPSAVPYGLKKRTKTREISSSLCHKKINNSLKTDKCMTAIPT